MLTRFKVNGFKNLVDVEVRFGPMTCIAGPNGAGKSNLFDAIIFLSALADQPLLEAAAAVRGEAAPSPHPEHLFHCVSGTRCHEMQLETEMIVPAVGEDDLGQPAHAAITFLKYRLNLALEQGVIKVREEALEYITRGSAHKSLAFPHSKQWRDSVVVGRRTAPLISTTGENGSAMVLLHQDQGKGSKAGRPRPHAAHLLPRTVLSTANAAESATAVLARREMQSWRLLQLEPSALRTPDSFRSSKSLGANGSHLPATLARIARIREKSSDASVLARVTNRLAELIEDVRSISVSVDEKLERLTLMLTATEGTEHEARSLSDGTLRFLALAVLQEDPLARGLLCLEEPENGIHPDRIPAMLRLLEDIAADPREPSDTDNPLRQVIVNTHSPSVVAQVSDADLLLALPTKVRAQGAVCERPTFRWLPDTWRAQAEPSVRTATRGDLLLLLKPPGPRPGTEARRVIDRPDIQPYLPFPVSE
jgi:predicted ATPase